MEDNKFNLLKIKRNLNTMFPMGYIPRARITDATGGLLSPQTLANYDNDKEKDSISGAVKIMGRICYPIDSVIDYIKSKTVELNAAN